MTSKNPGVSESDLLNLIYQHLKKNGHKKAANALKKHAPQLETTKVKVSLKDIFKRLQREENPLGRHSVEKPRNRSSAKTVSKPKKPRNAKLKISPTDKKKTKMASDDQKKKRTKKKEDKSSVPVKGQTNLMSKSPATGDDSDSDSSLDVEKWKKLALGVSDADIAKMDELTAPGSTSGTVPKKPAKRPAQRKKETSTNINAKKPKAKTAISPSKMKKTDKPTKSRTKKTTSTVAPDKVKTPSKKSKVKGSLSEKDITSSCSEQVVNPNADGLSENDGSKSKKKKHKKTENQAESNNTEPLTHSLGNNKPDFSSEIKQVDSPSKKARSRKSKSLNPVNTDTPSTGDNAEMTSIPLTSKSKKPHGTPSKKAKSRDTTSKHTDSENVSSDSVFDHSGKNDELSDPMLVNTKKAKSKKSSKSTKHVDVESPSVEADAEVPSEPVTSESDRPSKKHKAKTSGDLPSSTQDDTPAKKSKTKKSRQPEEPTTCSGGGEVEDVNSHSNFDQSESRSKKSSKSVKHVNVESPSVEADAEVPSEPVTSESDRPSKKHKAKTSGDLPSSTQDETPAKKSKTKKSRQPEEPIACSGGGGVEDVNSHTNFDESESLSNKSTTKKVKAKKTDSELNGTETPSKKMEAHVGHTHAKAVMPEVMPYENTTPLNVNSLSEVLAPQTPNKKSKTRKSSEIHQVSTPSNDTCLDAGGADKPQTSSKKSKSKKMDNVERDDVGSLSPNQNIASEDVTCPSIQKKHSKKKRKNKDEDGINGSVVEEGPEPKKAKKEKKKKKERDEGAVEEVQTALQSEELVDSQASCSGKKKKKKKKDRDEQEPLPSSPASEEQPPKKKKKSSKEKDYNNDATEEGSV